MKTLHDLAIRLLQQSGDGELTVFVRDRNNRIHPIEAIESRTVHVPLITDDMSGPIAHNEQVIIVDIGPAEGILDETGGFRRRLRTINNPAKICAGCVETEDLVELHVLVDGRKAVLPYCVTCREMIANGEGDNVKPDPDYPGDWRDFTYSSEG